MARHHQRIILPCLDSCTSANFVEPSDNTDKPKYYFPPWLGSTLKVEQFYDDAFPIGCSLQGLDNVPGVPIIAIVDDDVSVRAATDRFVRSLGLISRTFASAEDFLHSSCLHETSCVLADVHMPGMSGIDLQDHLLSLGHPVPIVFITAYPEVSVRARALNSGAVCFLSKPCDGPTMARCIDAALSRRNAGSSDN